MDEIRFDALRLWSALGDQGGKTLTYARMMELAKERYEESIHFHAETTASQATLRAYKPFSEEDFNTALIKGYTKGFFRITTGGIDTSTGVYTNTSRTGYVIADDIYNMLSQDPGDPDLYQRILEGAKEIDRLEKSGELPKIKRPSEH